MAMNERQIRMRKGGNFTTLDTYLDRRIVKEMPYSESYLLSFTAESAKLIVAATTITGNIYIDGAGLSGNGDIVAPDSGFTAGTAAWANTNITDAYGNILNKVEIRNSLTHDPVVTADDRQIWGLLQSSLGTADHDAVNSALGSENLQLSLFYVDASSVIQEATITEDIEFKINKEYKLRNSSTIEFSGGYRDIDIISDSITIKATKFVFTTGTGAIGSQLTLSTGAITEGGATTRTGIAFELTLDQYTDGFTRILLNGVEQDKLTDVTRIDNDTLEFSMIFDIDDRIDVVTKQ